MSLPSARLILPSFLILTASASAIAAPLEPRFESVTLDASLQIGYGVDIADVDGDGRPDVLLADKKQFVWYQNPGANWQDPRQWKKHVLAENLTTHDNVCITAKDIDGDGKCEIAVGAEWNPGDTENSGAVFYLIAPADRTKPWEAIKLHAEPTVHRMRWVPTGAAAGEPKTGWGLLVAPLHGRGNKNGAGAGVQVLLYRPPADPRAEWKREVVSDRLHMTHNFQATAFNDHPAILVGGKEALVMAVQEANGWHETVLADEKIPGFAGVGEIRTGHLPDKNEFLATVEPMHGNQLAVYRQGGSARERLSLTDKLVEGHALACGDLLGTGSDQIVIGWRGNPQNAKSIGVQLWAPSDEHGTKWQASTIDPDGMACEDLKLADLDGDGKLDVIASGRATHNLKIYFNRSGK